MQRNYSNFIDHILDSMLCQFISHQLDLNLHEALKVGTMHYDSNGLDVIQVSAVFHRQFNTNGHISPLFLNLS